MVGGMTAVTYYHPLQGMRPVQALLARTAPLQQSICHWKNKAEFAWNLLMSITEAFQRERGALWIELRHFSAVNLPHHGCSSAHIMKCNCRSIVHWCTRLLAAALLIYLRLLTLFCFSLSEHSITHDEKHKQQHSGTSGHIWHSRVNTLHNTFV